jgi:PAS domain S-box-containing protein
VPSSTIPYAVALALTALTLAVLSGVAWSRRAHTRGARSFTFFVLTGMVWAALEAVQLLDPDPSRQRLWLQLRYVGVAFLPLAFLVFAHEYTRQAEWLSRLTVASLAVIPAVTVVLAWTNDLHGLMWRSLETVVLAGRAALVTSGGIWFWVHASFSYLLLGLGSYYLLRAYVLTPGRYRTQVSLVLVAVLVPWAANLFTLTGVLALPGVDVTPLTFAVSALAFARSLFSHRLLDLVPVAQEAVLRFLSDAVVVADARQRVLQLNPAASRLLGAEDAATEVGRPLADLFAATPELLARLGNDLPDQVDVLLPTAVGRRHFNAHLTPLADRRGRVSGYLVRLQDIERQVHAVRTLRRAETTLEQQATYVTALQDVSAGLVERRGLEVMLDAVLRHAGAVLDARHGIVSLLAPGDDVLRPALRAGRFEQEGALAFRHGEGLSGRAWASREPLRVDDYRRWEGRAPTRGLAWTRAAIAAPMIANDEVVGVLAVGRADDDERMFGPAEETLLSRFAQLAAVAVQNVRLIDEIESRRRESDVLARIGTAMQEPTSLGERLEVILRAITEVVGMERAVAWLPSQDGEALEASHWIGFGPDAAREIVRVALDDSVPILAEAYREGREVVIEPDEPLPERYRASPSVASAPILRSRAPAALPLVARGQVVGVLAVDNPSSGRALAPSLPTLRRFVASAAVAIDSARLLGALQQELAERRLAEEELRRSEEKYRSILEQIEEAYFETDLRGRFSLVNPSLATNVLDPPERILGRSFRHYVHTDDVRGVLRSFRDVFSSRVAVQRREMRYRRSDGSTFYGETSISLILDEHGQPVGFRGLVRNVEDRKRYELQLRDAKDAAEAANASKSAFLANVSHELRTPLTSVLGFARLIERRVDEVVAPLLSEHQDPKVRRAVEQVRGNARIIYRESGRLTTLINELLDLAKIEAGRIEWNMRRLRLGDVIERALEATQGLNEQRPDVAVRSEVEPDLPEVWADGDRMVQVVINLISNALKFTPTGEVTVRAERDAERVVVHVRDTGIGIAPEDHAAVFEQFRQVGDTLTEKPQGTGLGLPICKQIVEHHGGRIWLESAPGEGSTFSFDLPLAPAGAPEGSVAA